MSTKLVTAALIALSVSKLEDELKTGAYSATELNEALDAETAGDDRSTAVKELKAALSDALALEAEANKPAPVVTAGTFVCKGKSITTAAGIKVAGDEIKAGMLPEKSAKILLDKKYLETRT